MAPSPNRYRLWRSYQLLRDRAVGLLSSCLIADQLANSAAADTESQGVL